MFGDVKRIFLGTLWADQGLLKSKGLGRARQWTAARAVVCSVGALMKGVLCPPFHGVPLWGEARLPGAVGACPCGHSGPWRVPLQKPGAPKERPAH